MARKLFGTDGIRGVYGEFPLDPATIKIIGYSAGKILGGANSRVLIGCDTRESSGAVKEALIRGFSQAGVASCDAGVFPTPAVAAMVKEKGFDFGAVISASHNPYEDNGIKFFSGGGTKFHDSQEEEIERLIEGSRYVTASSADLKKNEVSFGEDYLNWLLTKFSGLNLRGKKILLDSANGAAYNLAPRLFALLGAEVISIADHPDGRNINENCGSLHAGELAKKISSLGADFGFSYDGDADRCLALHPEGKVLDGDNLLYAEARRRKQAGTLKGNVVVGTVMSNYGLEEALAEEQIDFHRASVGDRYVLEALREKRGELGGEPSGHIIFLDMADTGDGLLTSLVYSRLFLQSEGMKNLAGGIARYAQKMINLKVREKKPIEGVKEIDGFLSQAERTISGEGRIVLRYSGTEPLLRVMIEAKSEAIVDKAINKLVADLKSVLT
jgi:phosphoglucosamine mutase